MITVCVVSYGSKDEIELIVQRLLMDGLDFKLIILENLNSAVSGWKDFSLKIGELDFLLIAPEQNIGFGPGINLILGEITTKFALFLNPDCLPSTNSVFEILHHMSSCECAITSGKLLKSPGHLDSFLPFVFLPVSKPVLIGGREYSSIFRKTHFPGAFFLVNVNELQRLGGYSNLFMYFDELDTTLRIQDKGGKVHLLDLEVGTHVRGTSSGDNLNFKSPLTAYCSTYSAIITAKSHYKIWLPLTIAARFTYSVSLLYKFNFDASLQTLRGILAGLGILSFKLPQRPAKKFPGRSIKVL
ncbi:MAG: hypothetical protein RLZZ44_1806 [Bacteroidota bacterium]